MVITSRTHTTLFSPAAASSNSVKLIRLPLSVVPHYEKRCEITGEIVPTNNKPLFRTNLWSSDEHERFLHGLELFPNGPWKEVAKIVGTKSTRQTMTHAQKYRQKIERRLQAKTAEPKQKPHRRSAQSTVSVYSGYSSFQDMMSAPAPPMTFFDELVTCAPVQQSAFATSSPTDVYNEAFDTSFLDEEFNVILSELKPLSRSHQFAQGHAGSVRDSFGVYA